MQHHFRNETKTLEQNSAVYPRVPWLGSSLIKLSSICNFKCLWAVFSIGYCNLYKIEHEVIKQYSLELMEWGKVKEFHGKCHGPAQIGGEGEILFSLSPLISNKKQLLCPKAVLKASIPKKTLIVLRKFSSRLSHRTRSTRTREQFKVMPSVNKFFVMLMTSRSISRYICYVVEGCSWKDVILLLHNHKTAKPQRWSFFFSVCRYCPYCHTNGSL